MNSIASERAGIPEDRNLQYVEVYLQNTYPQLTYELSRIGRETGFAHDPSRTGWEIRYPQGCLPVTAPVQAQYLHPLQFTGRGLCGLYSRLYFHAIRKLHPHIPLSTVHFTATTKHTSLSPSGEIEQYRDHMMLLVQDSGGTWAAFDTTFRQYYPDGPPIVRMREKDVSRVYQS